MRRGIGLYVRRMSQRTHGTPEEFAAKLAAHGVALVAFMACWQDQNGSSDPNSGKVGPYAKACLSAGVEPWLWGFPRPQTVFQTRYFGSFTEHVQDSGGAIKGFLHDPEVYWQRKGAKAGAGMRGQGEAISGVADSGASLSFLEAAALQFVDKDFAVRRALGVRDAGITSYGAARWFGLPWPPLARLGHGSPQIYSADTREKVQGYLSDWREFCSDLRPSLPTYGGNSGSAGAMLEHAARFMNPDGSVPADISGFWFWSWEQTRGPEWVALRELSKRFA